MVTNETDRLVLLGFNHGYTLEQTAPSVLKRILSMEHSSAYLLGLNKGQKESQHHRSVILGKKQDERSEMLKQIHAKNAQKEQNKDLEKE